MSKIIRLIFAIILLASTAACCEENPLTGVEARILSGDIEGAKKLFSSSEFIVKYGPPYHYKVQGEVKSVIRYFEELVRFRRYAKEPGKEVQVVSSTKSLIAARDKMPKIQYFSQTLADKINQTNKENIEIYAAASAKVTVDKNRILQEKQDAKEQELKEHEERVAQLEEEQAEAELMEAETKKACGADYGRIKVGMKLSHVQKCYGDFFLHGQVKGKYGVVDHYSRGSTYLFVKNGKVVAWGE